jgi:hypothetical protein
MITAELLRIEVAAEVGLMIAMTPALAQGDCMSVGLQLANK